MLQIRPLHPEDARTSFCCGNDALDRYFRNFAWQDAKRGYCSIFVAVRRPIRSDERAAEAGTDKICGFYTLSMASVDLRLIPDDLQNRLPLYPAVPAVRLGRLAASVDERGKGVGRLLLVDALKRSIQNEIAWAAFAVDAKDATARSFYLKYGFRSLSDDADHLFLTRKDVAALFLKR